MIRKARLAEIPEIYRLLNEYSGRWNVLPRSLSELYSYVRDFFVCRDDAGGPLLGIAALHVFWEDLGEIRSLLVIPSHQGRGLGSSLVNGCLEEARELGLKQVFVLTDRHPFPPGPGLGQQPGERLPGGSQRIGTETGFRPHRQHRLLRALRLPHLPPGEAPPPDLGRLRQMPQVPGLRRNSHDAPSCLSVARLDFRRDNLKLGKDCAAVALRESAAPPPFSNTALLPLRSHGMDDPERAADDGVRHPGGQ